MNLPVSSLTTEDKTRPDTPEISGVSGELISGKYKLGQVLGIGAMGTVWSAYHSALDQTVAVKLIAKEYAQSREARHRFRVEATAAARLRSRFVVQVFDSGETEDGLLYLAMEMLSGETLERRLEHGPLPLSDVVRITAQVARGLSLAHQQGIVHRDLKPANIFIAYSDDEAGEVAKVLDFGIAKVSDLNPNTSTTRTGTVLGTPQFMSPEQVRGLKSVDARSDIYSLGMVTYNMLTGKVAYEGEAFGDLLLSICTKDLPSVTGAAGWLPNALDEWFYRCCGRDPEERFQTADEAAEALLQASGLGPTLGNLNTLAAGGASASLATLMGSVPPPPGPSPGGSRSAPPPLPTAPRHPTIGGTAVMDVAPSSRSRPSLLKISLAAVAALGVGFGAVWLLQANPPKAEAVEATAVEATPVEAPGSSALEPAASVGLAPVEISLPVPDAGATPPDAGSHKPGVPANWKGFTKKTDEPDLGF